MYIICISAKLISREIRTSVRGEYCEGGGDTIRIAIQGRDTRYGSIQIINVMLHFMHEIPCIMLLSVLSVLYALFAAQLCVTSEVPSGRIPHYKLRPIANRLMEMTVSRSKLEN